MKLNYTRNVIQCNLDYIGTDILKTSGLPHGEVWVPVHKGGRPCPVMSRWQMSGRGTAVSRSWVRF